MAFKQISFSADSYARKPAQEKSVLEGLEEAKRRFKGRVKTIPFGVSGEQDNGKKR